MPASKDKLIIANMSGFYGDRFNAAKEMVLGGPIDVLTGDYLAELTMAILYKNKQKNPERGYATTFLYQMEEIMGLCQEKGIRVIVNAGGLNPSGLSSELKQIAETLGLNPKIAYLEGDDLMPRLSELEQAGEPLTHLDKGISLKEGRLFPITANAYLGCWGVVEALNKGADIIVSGRIADTSLVMGPSAWHFGWQQNDWDQLAGAAAAGHIIECGTQATGGNYSFFQEVPSFHNMGFPIAEMFADGSAIISKHPHTGGLVSVGTVTAQLFYEINSPTYLTPDVSAHFDTINLTQEGPDRVKVDGTRGSAPTDTAKVCINCLGGYKNSMTVILTGLDIEEKAKLVEEVFFKSVGGRDTFTFTDTQLIRYDKENPQTNEAAFAHLKISVSDPNPKKAGRLFSTKIVELALSNIPGFTFTSPPSTGQPAIIHWPALLHKKYLQQKLYIDEEEITIHEVISEEETPAIHPVKERIPAKVAGPTVKLALGRLFATRSGDKGGNANLGVWGKTPAAFAFLESYLTVDKLKELLPDTASFDIDRHVFANLMGLNFYIRGFLGEGVAASVKSDPQAKTLGEYLRVQLIEVPESLL